MRLSASIAHRLGAVLGGLLLIIVSMVALAWSQMGSMHSTEREIVDNWLPSVELVNELNTNTSDQRILEFRHVLNTDDAKMTAVEGDMQKLSAEFKRLNDTYKQLISSDQERALHAAFERSWGEYQRQHDQVLGLSRQNQNDQARALLEGEAQKTFDQATADLLSLIKLNREGAQAAGEHAKSTYAFARNSLLLAALVALVAGTAAALWLTRSITRPIASALNVAEGVAAGNLAQRIDVDSTDELGRLLGSLRTMQARLSEVVSGVRGSAEGVATASAQIAQGNLDLSQRTEEQASAVQQTAATMEEVGSTVRHNADSAAQANQMAQGASAVALRGGEVVGQVVQTMQGINDSSRKISDIIGVIDGIAFQTNILALNAAVEAARAGEQGRGFAVVASEVRSLAQRSATAAKEIKALIDDSVTSVETGSRLVGQAGSTMNEVVESVKRVSTIMVEITAANREQTASIERVNTSIARMGEVTQQNASMVDEAANSAQAMYTEADNLSHAISVFKLSENDEVSTSSSAGSLRSLGMHR